VWKEISDTFTNVFTPWCFEAKMAVGLHEAASDCTMDMQLLISAKADVDAIDEIGRTPLFVACQNASVGCAAMLLAAGAQVNKAMNSGATPLFTSAQNGHLDCVELLLWSGADVRWCTTHDGATPLFVAIANGHVKCALMLVDAQADVNAAKGDTSPLFVSASNGDVECTRLLLSARADPARARASGATPLLASCVKGSTACVQLLLEARAPVDMRRVSNEYTPLCVCALRGHTNCLALLLAAGADLERGREEKTPLYFACQHGALECARLLLAASADPGTASSGMRPIDVARAGGQAACVALLEMTAMPMELSTPGRKPTRGATAWARAMLSRPSEPFHSFGYAPEKREFGMALQRAEALGASGAEIAELRARAEAKRTSSVQGGAPLVELAREGRACMFLFLDASKLRELDDTDLVQMPSLRELTTLRLDWLVAKEVRLSDVCAGELEDTCLAVSHRWEDPSRPDPTGEQLRSVRAYLQTEAGRRFTLVWYDYSCLPLPSVPERWQHVAHTRHELAALEMQLPSISSLFLGCAVLILLDELYLGRFWPQLEAWLAMHSPSTEGLVPAPATSRRLTIMTIHGRPDDLESEIIRRWVARDVREVHEMLASSDVLVCNETDREQQLRRLLELDVQVRAHAPPTWPNLANLAPPPLGSPVALAREKALSPVAVAREALSFEEVEAPATSKLVPSLSSIVESRTLGDEGDEKLVGVSVSVGGATCQGGGQRQGGSGQWQGGVARARLLKADSAGGKEKHADSPEGLPVLQWLPPGLPSPGCRQSLSLTHPTLLGLSSPTSAVLGVGSTATALLVRPPETSPVLYALRRASPASPGMQAATPVNVPEEQRNESSSRTSLAAAGLVSAAAAASDAERAQRMRMQLAGLQRPNSPRAGSPAASVQPSTSPLASLQPSTSPMASLQRPKSPPAGLAGPQALRNWVVPSRTTTPKGAQRPGPAASTAEDDSDRIPMAMMTDAISSLPPTPPSLVVSAPLLLPSGSSSKSGSPSISGDTSCPKAGGTGSSSASPCATPAESSRESPSDSTPFGSSLAAKLRRPTLFRRLLGAKSSTSSEGGNKGER